MTSGCSNWLRLLLLGTATELLCDAVSLLNPPPSGKVLSHSCLGLLLVSSVECIDT